MKNTIDFKEYPKENNITKSCKIRRLEAPITFDDIGVQVCLYLNRKGSIAINLEPEYHGMEYAEIDIEFYDIQSYSFVIEGKPLYCESHPYYTKILDFRLDNKLLHIKMLFDSGKQAELYIKFKHFLLDYDKSLYMGYEMLEILYGYKKEENRLLEMLYAQVSDEILSNEYTLYYSYYKNELFEILEVYKDNGKLSESEILNEYKILDLHTHKDITIIQKEIAQSFPFVLYLIVNYDQLGYEEPIAGWLVTLCSLSKNFSKVYKEELLRFYIDYLFTKHTYYTNPLILLSFLIIVMMIVLEYPQKEIDNLWEEFCKSDYIGRYDCHFFTDGTLDKFRWMLTILDDEKKEVELFTILEKMITEYSEEKE